MRGRFYITTPIYYVNDVPHLGTAYTTVIADAVRRYHLLRGDETRLLTGTDEHGLKIEREAKEHHKSPTAFVDEISQRFRMAWPELGIETDDFVRTTEPRHIAFVQDLWRRIRDRGQLYLGAYEDWYCLGCESFKTEKELLPGNLCPIHARPVERVKEETYFFRLSEWQKPLLELYARRPEFIQPPSRRNEVISFVEGGLRDLSVSRTSFSWGVPVPDDPRHVMYVWFDALSNYRSVLGPPEGDLARFWAPNARVVHLVGKDILRFHTVYWPAFLLAAGYREDELPNIVFAHGFLTIDGQKMSKSLRNAVDPIRLARELGADVVRYYLLRAVAFGQDGDFDHAALVERYNADLGKNLGNLLQRTLGLCAKMTSSKTPGPGEPGSLEQALLELALTRTQDAAEAWDALAPHRALESTWELASAANQYVDRAAPWTAAKEGQTGRVEAILGTLLRVLESLSVMIWPAMPRKSQAMRKALGLEPLNPQTGSDLWPRGASPLAHGRALSLGEPLFPTYDKDQEKALLDRLVPKPESKALKSPPVTETDSSSPPSPLAEGTVTYDQFAAVDLRVGVVSSAERVPKKDKLLLLKVDLGEASPRTIVAGLALTFKPEDLQGRRVVVVANLAPRDFGKGLVSHGMLLATGPSEALHLATVDESVAPGARLK